MAAETIETPLRTDRSELRLYPIDAEWSARLPALAAEIDEQLDHHPQIMIFGKIAHQNRSVSFFSDVSIGYYYSGKLAASKPLTDSLRVLLAYINQQFDAEFNGILINKYDGGEESIGKHSDDEKALDRRAGVVALSTGAVRTFRIRDKATGKIVADVPTHPNYAMQMWGDFQKEFTHEIPVEKRVKGVRYSFTFRKHLL